MTTNARITTWLLGTLLSLACLSLALAFALWSMRVVWRVWQGW